MLRNQAWVLKVMNAFHGRTAMALYVTIVELARLDIFIKCGMIGKL
jgi:4-aminobutyrate aminotransferase-like enzyme